MADSQKQKVPEEKKLTKTLNEHGEGTQYQIEMNLQN